MVEAIDPDIGDCGPEIPMTVSWRSLPPAEGEGGGKEEIREGGKKGGTKARNTGENRKRETAPSTFSPSLGLSL